MCRKMWAFYLVVILAISADASGNDSHSPVEETRVIARGKLLVGTGGDALAAQAAH